MIEMKKVKTTKKIKEIVFKNMVEEIQRRMKVGRKIEDIAQYSGYHESFISSMLRIDHADIESLSLDYLLGVADKFGVYVFVSVK
jgi:hypothetical protein